MNTIKQYIYLIPILFFLTSRIPLNKYPPEGKYKFFFLFFTLLVMWISANYEFKIINEYILPYCLFINVLILVYFTINEGFNFLDLIRLIGILYLLFTFNREDFICKNGILVKLNKSNIKWTISYIIIISLWFLLENKGFFDIKEKLLSTLILFIPLIFPFKEYYVHRVFIVVLGITLKYLMI